MESYIGEKDPVFGGYWTDIGQLPAGTTFYVANGHWYGRIVMRDGCKHVEVYAVPEVSGIEACGRPRNTVKLFGDGKTFSHHNVLSISEIRYPEQEWEDGVENHDGLIYDMANRTDIIGFRRLAKAQAVTHQDLIRTFGSKEAACAAMTERRDAYTKAIRADFEFLLNRIELICKGQDKFDGIENYGPIKAAIKARGEIRVSVLAQFVNDAMDSFDNGNGAYKDTLRPALQLCCDDLKRYVGANDHITMLR